MNKTKQINPYKILFESCKKYNKAAEYVLYLSTLFSILIFLLKDIQYVKYLLFINCLLIVLYPILCFISDLKFYDSSLIRRSDFIDNSLDSKLSESRSKEYYSNDDLSTGYYKIAVNGFENSLFTYNIAKKMTLPLWVKTFILAAILISFAILGYTNAFVLFVQLSLPIFLLQQSLKHTLFVYRIKSIYGNYRNLFNSSTNKHDISKKIAEILITVLNYETTLTYGAILLDTKIYNSLNSKLSQEWNRIKIEYRIKEK